MIRTRKQKIVTLSLVFIAVLTLSIGFAVFSNNLLIKSKLAVNPDVKFGVVFSKSASSVTAGNITPTVYGSATAEAATIDNSTVPTLNNISATFKKPGDKVVYSLYAYNSGGYEAYLTNIIFNNASGGSTFKVCTAGSGTTQSTVNSACNSIRVTVKAGTTSATATQTVSNHLLAKATSEAVTVTIEYLSNGSEANGPFTVNFGDISFVYSSVDGGTSTGSYAVGDIVTLGGENFYVIPNDSTAHTLATDGTVTLLAKYNILVSTNDDIADYYPHQKTGDTGSIVFSSSWDEVEDGKFVYNLNSNLSPYVEKYKQYLINKGLNVILASIPSKTQLDNLVNNILFSNDDYWTGTYDYDTSVWCVTTGSGFTDPDACQNSGREGNYGIRPVIIVNESDLN